MSNSYAPLGLVVYRSDNWDDPRLNFHGLIWTSEDAAAAADYAYLDKPGYYLYAYTLKPSARIVDLRDTSNPLIRKIKDSFSTRRRMTAGYELTDEQWSESEATFELLEMFPWVAKFLRSKRVDGVKVIDTHQTYDHDSIALLNTRCIDSVEKVGPLSVQESKGVFRTLVDCFLFEKDIGYYVPDKFYMVFDLPGYGARKGAWVDQINSGRILGVSGVSAKPDIIRQFGYRGGVLVMPGYEFVQSNQLSRIQYENPHYLVQDNLAALFRIWDKPQDKGGRRGVLFNLGECLVKVSDNARFREAAEYRALWQYVADLNEESWPVFKGLDHLSNWLYDAYAYALMNPRSTYTTKDNLADYVDRATFKRWLVKALDEVSRVYRDEFEWRVKNKVMTIPKGSELWYLLPTRSVNTYKRVKGGEPASAFGTMDLVADIDDVKNMLKKVSSMVHVKVKTYKEVGIPES